MLPLFKRLIRSRTSPTYSPDLVLSHAGKRPGFFFIQVGAMDGHSFDPIHAFILKFGWHGLLIEPIPERFEQLQQIYRKCSGLIFENIAIDRQLPNVTMHYIPDAAIAAQALPNWARGISCIRPERVALGGAGEVGEELRAKLASNACSIEVPSCPLSTLIKRHGINRIDLLQIDAEGHDFEVLFSLDWSAIKPNIIQLEYYNLSKTEKAECVAFLADKNYHIFWPQSHQKDLFCVQNGFI